jgi:hypothetical protein
VRNSSRFHAAVVDDELSVEALFTGKTLNAEPGGEDKVGSGKLWEWRRAMGPEPGRGWGPPRSVTWRGTVSRGPPHPATPA